MMAEKKKFTPTPKQEKVINAGGEAIVVSAAAGSGKTTVLIERIIRMVRDENVGVDELLVATFTRAATAEIRTKLATAIATAIKSNPENSRLLHQQMLVPSADIYTIDAFCASLIFA